MDDDSELKRWVVPGVYAVPKPIIRPKTITEILAPLVDQEFTEGGITYKVIIVRDECDQEKSVAKE